MIRLLILEDDDRARESLVELVSEEGFEVRQAANLAEARACIDEFLPAVAIVDLDLPDGNGLELVRDLETRGQTEVLVLTGHGSVDTAVEAMRNGVFDYLTKPVEPNRLLKALHDCRRTVDLRAEVDALRDQLRTKGRFAGIVGTSPGMREVFDHIAKVAPTSSSVMVLGETGTGKELVARAVHELSTRKAAPFVAVNCAAIQDSLIESELFGHEAGAFTGAQKRRVGLFEQAHGGTLFLDEILEMQPDLQVRLLRVLESNTIRRVGGNEDIEVDVRLITATNRDPQESMQGDDVREDLVYRLMVFPIRIPPLRHRSEDIPLLVQHFLDLLAQLNGDVKEMHPAAMDRLRGYDWPGNVRELRNIVERAYILGDSEIDDECIVLDAASSEGVRRDGDEVTIQVGTRIADAERALILATLDSFGGDKPRAAEALGISLRTLYNRLETYG